MPWSHTPSENKKFFKRWQKELKVISRSRIVLGEAQRISDSTAKFIAEGRDCSIDIEDYRNIVSAKMTEWLRIKCLSFATFESFEKSECRRLI